MIPFSRPSIGDLEKQRVLAALESGGLCGDKQYSQIAQKQLQKIYCDKGILLTHSGTGALEMAALLADVQSCDEVILPSFTFSSTATAFALRGAQLRFVDIEPENMNISVRAFENAITAKTKVVVPVHYGGVACDMKSLMSVAKNANIFVVEDAAQALGSFDEQGLPLGGIGDLGCLSFHETKNIVSGEGGALILNRQDLMERAEIIREKGTNRKQFFKGQVDKYTWQDIGSSFLMADLNAALLSAQLDRLNEITERRLRIWSRYLTELSDFVAPFDIQTSVRPRGSKFNGHLFYMIFPTSSMRDHVMSSLKQMNITAVFHYLPLHSSPAGQKFGKFIGTDNYTTSLSSRLLRLPLYADFTDAEQTKVIESLKSIITKL